MPRSVSASTHRTTTPSSSISLSQPSFRLADVMQHLVDRTTAANQQWKRLASESGDDRFETDYKGLRVQLRARGIFSSNSAALPDRLSQWELRFSAPHKKEKVIDGQALDLSQAVSNSGHGSDSQSATGTALIRQLIVAVYRWMHHEKQQHVASEFLDVLPAIEALYHQALDGLVSSCVRHIPASPLNPLAGGATVLEVGNTEQRLEVTAMRLNEKQSIRITLRQGQTVHKLPRHAMDHPVISDCITQLLAIITPPAPAV